MSTKEVRYVRSLNCICYKELSQSVKVKYFIIVEQNFGRSCEHFPLLSPCFFRSGVVPPKS